MDGHRIREAVNIKEFMEKIKNYSPEDVLCTGHTFFRLSEKQKGKFNCETIKEYLFEAVPVLVGIQYNGCYAAFYKYIKQRIIRIILDMKADKIHVVTFYVIERNQMPVIKWAK